MNNYYTRWTKEEDNILLEQYPLDLLKNVHKKFFPHRTYKSLRRRVRILNINKQFYTSIDESLFEKPTILSCWIMGFFAADGCICDKGWGRYFLINLSQKDLDYLKTIAEKIKYIGKISMKEIWSRLPQNTEKTLQKSCSITARISDECVNNIQNIWNITPRKTLTLQPPNLTELVLLCHI